MICASPDYLAQHGTPREQRDLRHHERVGYAYESEHSWAFGSVESRDEPTNTTNRVQTKIRHYSNNGEFTRQLVLAGQGIAQLPTFLVADDIRARRLEILLAGQMSDVIPIQAIYPHRRHLSAKVRAFVDHLIAHCGAQPPSDEGLGV